MIPFKKRSLRFRLIIVISFISLLIWTLSTTVAWIQVRKEINQVFDAQQILFAERLASSNLHTMLSDRRPPENRKKHHRKAEYDDDALAFAVFSARGDMLLHDGNNGEYFHFTPKINGFSISQLSNDNDPWQIFWLPVAGGRLLIAVGQELDYRDDLTEEMVLNQMWIWFASLPLLLTLIVLIINYELKTLRNIGETVANRTPEDTTPLTHDVPKEITPLVHSLNQFFNKTSDMLLRERRFTSDAAHELRSPLAALKIQTEIAQIAGDDVELRDKALVNLTQGINRASQLIEQLLTLSRLDNLQQLEGVEEIHWEKLIPSLIGELYFHADRRDIELQFEQHSIPKAQRGQPILLATMLRNLIENAIKYCPEETIVRITLAENEIIIEDNGGGVEESDLAKLGQRFYRPAGQNEKGSGLGLSIVKRIAELHHYQVQLDNSNTIDGKKGLRVRVLI